MLTDLMVLWAPWLLNAGPLQKVSPLNRHVLAIALGIALCLTVGASVVPLFVKPATTPCAYFSTPVRFIRIDSAPVESRRKTYRFPVVEYNYTVSGTQYISKRMFCRDSNTVSVDWSKVERFFDDARGGAEVVAWVRPSSPESACISPDIEFSYSVMSNTSAQCRAN